MVAAPFKGQVIFQPKDGSTDIVRRVTVSDVNGEFYVDPDNSENFITFPKDGRIYDVVNTGSGTDTTQASINVNGNEIGSIMNALAAGTVARPHIAPTKLIHAGTPIFIKQLT